MKGDFSRITFDRKRHYSGVRWQQGRPTTDADENEAQEIAAYRIETEAADVIGPSGAPQEKPGFALSLTSKGQLTIGAGRYYVDGILCENEAPVSYSAQPDLPDPPGLKGLLDNAQAGLVYLEVFRRHLTFQNHDAMRDSALSGVDTTTRLQTVWQVKVLPLPSVKLSDSQLAILAEHSGAVAEVEAKLGKTTSPSERAALLTLLRRLRRRHQRAAAQLGLDCHAPFPEWEELTKLSTGALTVTTIAVADPTDPCDVPLGGGYTRGENQLYIVEVHSVPDGGGRSGATFKWSRDNGSVVARITAVGSAESGTASGTVFDVDSVQRDDYLGIHVGDLVEHVDDGVELKGLPGQLRRVTAADVNLGRITLDGALTVNLDRRPRLRKWDQESGAALPMNTGDVPVRLESGVELQFADGTYRPGDYWQFAARAVTGTVDFPDGPQPPFGVRRHYARLGLLVAGREGPQLLLDCRAIFPPLTRITADDVRFDNSACNLPDTETVQDAIEQLCAREGGGGTCALTVRPGASWAEVFQRVPAGADAEICFAAGAYELDEMVMVEGKGHLRLHGIGPGTRIVARAECALAFRGCASVSIAHMEVEALHAEMRDNQVAGAVTCESCGSVTLESVTLRCAAATLTAAACLHVMNGTKRVSMRDGLGLVELRNAQLLVGHNQIGARVTGCARLHVDNVVVRCVDGRTDLMRAPSGLAENRELRAELRRVLYSDVQLGDATGSNRFALPLGRVVVTMRVDPRLIEIKFFEQLRERFPHQRVTDLPGAEAYLAESVDALLLKPDTISTFVPYFERLIKGDTAALFQGIAVTSAVAEEMRVRGCTIVDALQGISVAQVAEGERERPGVGTVHIDGVTITSRIAPSVNRGGFGVFVGSCESLLVEGSRVEREANEATQNMDVNGIHVEGQLGRRAIVRHNHTERYRAGVFIGPRNKLPPPNAERRALPPGQAPLWLVADNTGRVEVTSPWVRVEGNVE